MSEKTITQLALDAGVETGGTENALAILKFAKAYADQEKRSTAISFAEWSCKNLWSTHGGLWYSYHDEDNPITGDQLYDLYINPLPKTV